MVVLVVLALSACRQPPPQTVLDAIVNRERRGRDSVTAVIVKQGWDENRNGVYHVTVRTSIPVLNLFMHSEEMYQCDRRGKRWGVRWIQPSRFVVSVSSKVDTVVHEDR